MNYIYLINEYYFLLIKLEWKVVDFIFNFGEFIIYSIMNDIKIKVNVGDVIIICFC